MRKLILIALVLCSCTPRWENLPVCVNATTEEEIAVLDIFNEYCGNTFEVCDGQITIDYVDDLTIDGEAMNGWCYNHWTTDGITDATILVDSGLSRGKFPYTLAHELAHALGRFEHDTEPSLMSQPVDHSRTAKELVREFCETWFAENY